MGLETAAILGLGSLASGAASSALSPGEQEIKSFEALGNNWVNPSHLLGGSTHGLASLANAWKQYADNKLDLGKGARVQKIDQFSGGGLPMALGGSIMDPAWGDYKGIMMRDHLPLGGPPFKGLIGGGGGPGGGGPNGGNPGNPDPGSNPDDETTKDDGSDPEVDPVDDPPELRIGGGYPPMGGGNFFPQMGGGFPIWGGGGGGSGPGRSAAAMQPPMMGGGQQGGMPPGMMQALSLLGYGGKR